MESTGSTFPKWQLAILLGAPLAIGLSYLYWKNNQQAIEETGDEDDQQRKKISKGMKSISIDGDVAAVVNGTKTSSTDAKKKPEKLSPLEEAIKHKETGNLCFKNGKYDEAIDAYDKAIAVCPLDKTTDLSQFYQNRAAAYEQLKKWQSVADDCTQALELNPKYTKALARRARAFENLDQFESCLEDITAVAILEGFQNQNSLIFADRILKSIGELHAKEAMKHKQPVEPSRQFVKTYFKSFTKDPIHKVVESSQEARGFLRATKAFRDGNFSEIVPACTEEIETSEDDSEYKLEAILLRATMSLLTGQYDSALADFNTIIDNPEADKKLRSNALTKRASLYMQTERKDESMVDFDKAIQIDPENPDIYHHRGQVYLLLEQVQDACDDFTKSTELAPKNPLCYVHKLYAEYRQAVNDQDNAKLFKKVEEFSDATNTYADCVEVYSLFAQILSDQQQFQLADGYFEKAMKLEPENAGLYVHRGLLTLQWKGDMNTAFKMLEKAIEVDDKCEFAYETLGTVEVQRGNLERAIELFEKALKLAKSEMELTHIFSLKDAAQAQLNVTKKMGISLQSLMANMPSF